MKTIKELHWQFDEWMTKLFIYLCAVDMYCAEKSGNSKWYAAAAQDKSNHEGRLVWLHLNKEIA